MSGKSIRLQKYLAERGAASRRGAADLIAAGRVAVDGRTVLEPGCRIAPDNARVSVDGRPLPAALGPRRAIVLHKPAGCVCSRNGQGRPTVYEFLKDIPETMRPVGRLDADSDGLLIMTNSGAWIQALTHPRYGAEKTYRIDVLGSVDPNVLERLRAPMTLDGYRIRPVAVRVVRRNRQPAGARLEFVLREGRNRQIRKMCDQVGLRVSRLTRIEQAGILLDKLPPGQWRELTPREQAAIERHVQKAMPGAES